MKPLKQALVNELTAALAPILPAAAAGALPKGVAHAVEDLADSILRWRASQQRVPRFSGIKSISSEAYTLTQFMDSRLHEDDEPAPVAAPPSPSPVSIPAGLSEEPKCERKRRARLGIGR